MTAGPVLVVDFLGRPLLANQVHQMHHREVSKHRKQYREAGARLARLHKLGTHQAVTVTAWAEYPNRRSLPDADAIAPGVKGFIDGIVDAGVIPDDGPDHVTSVTYLAPKVRPGATPALCITITPADGEA